MSNLDLLVVNPAAAHGIYGPLGSGLIAVEPPQWARIIASAARAAGYEVAILDAEALGLVGDEAAIQAMRMIGEETLVCVAVYGHQPSASTQQMFGAGEFIRAFDKLNCDRDYRARTVIVGGHPSALPFRTMTEEPFDYLAKGEGIATILGLLRGDLVEKIPGLWWRDDLDGAIHHGDPAPLAQDLDALVADDTWDLLPMESYRAHNWQCLDDLTKRQPYASIFTSLGCPYKCSFCCINAPFASNRYRMRTPQDVVDEVGYLYQVHGVRTFKITDEMFVLNERHYAEICEKLAATGLGSDINAWAYARVDTIRPRNLKLLFRGGVRWLALGIESGSKHVRDGALKSLRQEDIVGTVRAIQDAGINVIGNFMFGLRDDDRTTMQQTLDLALDCRPDWANFYCTMAYPGSPLYDQAVIQQWTLPKTWRGYSQHNDDCRPLDTEHVGGAEVLEFRDKAFNEFFGNAGYLGHVRHKFGDAARAHVEAMTSYKLKRRLLEAE